METLLLFTAAALVLPGCLYLLYKDHQRYTKSDEFINGFRIKVGNLWVPFKVLAADGLAVLGHTRKGKSQLCLACIDSVLTAMKEGRPVKLALFLPRGEDKLVALRLAKTKVLRCRPDYLDLRAHVPNFLADLRTLPELKQFAAALVRKLRNENEFFTEGALTIVFRLVQGIYELRHDPRIDFALRTILLVGRYRRRLMRFLKKDPEVREALRSHLAKKGRLAGDMFATVASALDQFAEIAAGFDLDSDDPDHPRQQLSMRGFLAHDGPAAISVRLPVDQSEAHRPFLEWYVRQFCELALANRDNPTPLVMVFDEFTFLLKGFSDMLKDLMARLRTYGAGNNILVIVNWQGNSFLRDATGKEYAAGIMEEFGHKVYFQAHYPTSLEMAEDVGKKEFYDKDSTIFNSDGRYTKKTDYIIPPQLFTALRPPENGLLHCYVRINGIGISEQKVPFLRLAEEIRKAPPLKTVQPTYDQLKLEPLSADELDALGLLPKKKAPPLPPPNAAPAKKWLGNP